MNNMFDQFHKIFVCTILFLLGARLLDNRNLFYLSDRFAYGELLFALYFFGVILKSIHTKSVSWIFISKTQKQFTYYLIGFAIWCGLSWSINTIWRYGDIMDFFGIPVRVMFYAIMSIFVARWVKKYGPSLVVISFCCGILAIFYLNFDAMVAAMNIVGVPDRLPENNFSGVMLPVSAIFLAIAGMVNPGILTLLLMCLSFGLTSLVYSLGGFLFMIMGLPAVLLSVHNYFTSRNVGMGKRFAASAVFIVIGIFIIVNFSFAFEAIEGHIQNKINNIPFFETGQDHVQSGDIRWGFFLSSLAITANNPIFGVGEYNFQAEHWKNRGWLGDKYFDHKNPHNGLAQILSTAGIPAFYLFGVCSFITFKKLFTFRNMGGVKWKVFALSTFCVFLGTANVMATIYTTYYFYFFAGLVFGIVEWAPKMTISCNAGKTLD